MRPGPSGWSGGVWPAGLSSWWGMGKRGKSKKFEYSGKQSITSRRFGLHARAPTRHPINPPPTSEQKKKKKKTTLPPGAPQKNFNRGSECPG